MGGGTEKERKKRRKRESKRRKWTSKRRNRKRRRNEKVKAVEKSFYFFFFLRICCVSFVDDSLFKLFWADSLSCLSRLVLKSTFVVNVALLYSLVARTLRYGMWLQNKPKS